MLIAGSVLPVTGFFYLAFRAESEIDIRHWQWGLTERILSHRAAVETDVRKPERLSKDAVRKAIEMETPEAADCDKEKLYEFWEGTKVYCLPSLPTEEATLGPGRDPTWAKVFQFLHVDAIGLQTETAQPGGYPRGVRSGLSNAQLFTRAPGTDVFVLSRLWDLPLLPGSPWCWIFAAVLVAAGCIWVWIAA
jgi:hypothetical protein